MAHRAGARRCYYSQSRVTLPWFDGKDQSRPLDGGAILRNPRKEAHDEVFGPRPDGTSWASQDPGHEFSSILAWKTPWMEEPGRLQSMGSQWTVWRCLRKIKIELPYPAIQFLGIYPEETLI